MHDMLNFCTLFDSNYIDRALVMYQSLEAVLDDFKLYVIAFDLKCEEILKDRNFVNMEVISYKEFEDDLLRKAKSNRSFREYIWTCSGFSIKYVLDHYRLPACTYIDADMFFYKSPLKLLQNLKESGGDVGIIAHGFARHPEYKRMERRTGRYCVQFNTFINNENGRKILDWWTNQCYLCCTEIPDDIHFGDQKYLDQFKERFTGVYEYVDIGAGMAPWNLDRFCMIREGYVKERKSGKSSAIIFCHFHSLDFIGDKANINVFIRPGKHDKKLVYNLYVPYVQKISDMRNMLEKQYGLSWKVKEKYIVKTERHKLLKDFLTSEPSIWFLVRKVYRFVFFKKFDFIDLNRK